jgi:hypothetical protein
MGFASTVLQAFLEWSLVTAIKYSFLIFTFILILVCLDSVAAAVFYFVKLRWIRLAHTLRGLYN